ncbi:hypothetical protein ONR57_21210 [Hoyosella sp. YIM 151337]|uniref:hypothetical protein n=1 Tax=Hoyosella sp. YIM 151337 TaxID=2992742 RepID=UPI0022360572|nr:hypothetical protein [Hoyosella sp. YIM 151337]MCW4355827.1 hypothetical protein [Hoyosella sp. YIM 151337]
MSLSRSMIAGFAVLALAAGACTADEREDAAGADDRAEVQANYLYTMSGFSSGRLDPVGEGGEFALLLEDAPSGLVFFSDRPRREVGTVSTSQFLQEFDFVDDPPNAALAIESAGEADIAVFELTAPDYDAHAATLRFSARHLVGGEVQSEDFGSAQALLELDMLPAEFGPSALFIDSSCSFWDPRGC